MPRYALFKDNQEFKGHYGSYETAFVFAHNVGWTSSSFDIQRGLLTHFLKDGYEIKELPEVSNE